MIDEIHQPGAGVPRRMAPLILLGTLITHLCGGSAGREGTALQMGGSVAAAWARRLQLDAASVPTVLMAGVAAGFGSVFGTPVAGAVFALEVLVVGRVRHDALLPCLTSAILADWTCRAWGVGHTHYPQITLPGELASAVWLMGKCLLAGGVFGWVAWLFSRSSHHMAAAFQTLVPRPEWRPVVGGFMIIGLVFLLGTTDYLGLGVIGQHPHSLTLPGFFSPAQEVPATAWLWKLVFTVITLSAGFKGGEVTPLFFIGAALGNSLASIMGAPVDLFAALGFVAIFAGATKTPLASTFLGVELFGAEFAPFLAAACLTAYACSGSRGIYRSQRQVGRSAAGE